MAERLRYDAVFFDLDDTLAITRRIKFAMHKAIAKEHYGLNLTDSHVAACYNLPVEESLRTMYGDYQTPANELFLRVDAYHYNRFARRPIPGALKLINYLLQSGTETGIITGSPEHFVVSDLRRMQFPIDAMSGIYCYNTGDIRKPNPAVFDKPIDDLIIKTAISTPRVLYVGDGIEDYQAAHARGIDFIAVTSGQVDEVTFRAEGQTTIVPSVADITACLR